MHVSLAHPGKFVTLFLGAELFAPVSSSPVRYRKLAANERWMKVAPRRSAADSVAAAQKMRAGQLSYWRSLAKLDIREHESRHRQNALG